MLSWCLVKLGVYRGYTFFLFLLRNIDCGFSLEPPSNVYLQSTFWFIRFFFLKTFSFWWWNFQYIWIYVLLQCQRNERLGTNKETTDAIYEITDAQTKKNCTRGTPVLCCIVVYFPGLGAYTLKHDVWVLYDIGTNKVISAIAFWGEYTAIGKLHLPESLAVSSASDRIPRGRKFESQHGQLTLM